MRFFFLSLGAAVDLPGDVFVSCVPFPVLPCMFLPLHPTTIWYTQHVHTSVIQRLRLTKDQSASAYAGCTRGETELTNCSDLVLKIDAEETAKERWERTRLDTAVAVQ